MPSLISFPRDLLKASNLIRQEYFRTYTVAHPKLAQAYDLLRKAITDSIGGTLLFLYGSTGSGKTTIMRKIEREIALAMLEELKTNVIRLPVICVPAISPETGNFNWKDFFRRVLMALNESFLGKRLNFSKDINQYKSILTMVKDRAVGSELRYAVEQNLKLHRPSALLIDDAQHIAHIASGRKYQTQLDCIKSLADVTGVTIGLIGTYELLGFRNLSAQLSRRSIDIHLLRYKADVVEDVVAFKNTLWAFQRHLPLKEEADLLSNWDLFYERSIGCIGVLKDWLLRALTIALRDQEPILTKQHIESTCLSVAQCNKMLAEATEGENKLIETKASRMQLRAFLGLEPNNLPLDKPKQSVVEKPEQNCEKELTPLTENHKKTRRYPGRRKPKRDPIIVN